MELSAVGAEGVAGVETAYRSDLSNGATQMFQADLQVV
jgi:hypothetical protein